MTSKHSYGPSKDWIKVTQTSQAKTKIKQFFKKQKRDENISKGRELVEKEIRSMEIEPKDVFTADNLKMVAEKFNFTSEEDMFAAVGYQGITAAQIATRLTEKIRRKQQKEQDLEETLEGVQTEIKNKPNKKKDSGVKVKGVDNLLVRLSRCCNPVPGDDIVGYITKGRGVSVHRADCPNVQTEDVKQRLLPVEWEGSVEDSKQYSLDIEISGYDRRGLLNEVLHAVNETKTNITAVTGKSDKNKMATINMTIMIHNVSHLRRVVDRIKQIPDVYTVRRMLQ